MVQIKKISKNVRVSKNIHLYIDGCRGYLRFYIFRQQWLEGSKSSKVLILAFRRLPFFGGPNQSKNFKIDTLARERQI